MTRRLLAVAALVGVWLALWEDLSLANAASGLVLATAAIALFAPSAGGRPWRLRPVATLRFVTHFFWKLLEASAIVGWEVATPRNRINEGIVAVPIHGTSDALTTLVANAISLTPGTLTLEVDRDPPTLYVHVLHLRDIEAVRHEVQRLERLAIRAFGDHSGEAAPDEDAADKRKDRAVGASQATAAVMREEGQ